MVEGLEFKVLKFVNLLFRGSAYCKKTLNN